MLVGIPLNGIPTKSAVFIMTSDFGSQGFARNLSLKEIKSEAFQLASYIYKNGKLTQAVEILPFRSLSMDDFESIAKQKFKQLPCILHNKYKNHGICVGFTPVVTKIIATKAWQNNARNARAVISEFDQEIGPIHVELIKKATLVDTSKKIKISFDVSTEPDKIVYQISFLKRDEL